MTDKTWKADRCGSMKPKSAPHVVAVAVAAAVAAAAVTVAAAAVETAAAAVVVEVTAAVAVAEAAAAGRHSLPKGVRFELDINHLRNAM